MIRLSFVTYFFILISERKEKERRILLDERSKRNETRESGSSFIGWLEPACHSSHLSDSRLIPFSFWFSLLDLWSPWKLSDNRTKMRL